MLLCPEQKSQFNRQQMQEDESCLQGAPLPNTYVFYVMNVLVSLSVTHHFVEAEFVLSKEER